MPSAISRTSCTTSCASSPRPERPLRRRLRFFRHRDLFPELDLPVVHDEECGRFLARGVAAVLRPRTEHERRGRALAPHVETDDPPRTRERPVERECELLAEED